MKKPEEIVKALDRCIKGVECGGCPYDGKNRFCVNALMTDASEVIKSLLKRSGEHFANPGKMFGDQIRIGIDVPRTTTAVTYQYIYANETNVNLLIGQSSLGSAEIRKAMEEEHADD